MLQCTKLQGQTVISLLGGPGAGKGTQSKLLYERLGIIHISAGDLLRREIQSGSQHGALIDHMIKEGLIVPHEITVELLKAEILRFPGQTIIIDGFPRAIDQLEAFEKAVTRFEFCLVLDCPEEVLRERLLERGRSSGRSDDNVESIMKRFFVFKDQTQPVIHHFEEEGRLKMVRSDDHVDVVFERLRPLFAPIANKKD
ncbi:hypothetical protein P9112_008866 [Eukaryota sp. TZLM1-RC]